MKKGRAPTIFLVTLFVYLACAPATLFFAAEVEKTSPPQKQKNRLTSGELLKTKASRLFIARKYSEALSEFRSLEGQYPLDTAIRRYIAVCLYQLDRFDEAMAAFKELVALDAADLASRKHLGMIYLRNGNMDEAEQEFNFLKAHDKKGKYKSLADAQLKAIQGIKEGRKHFESAGSKASQLSPDQFLKSEAAQHFMKARYDEAVKALAAMEKSYPGDLVVLRYKGLALHKLKRYDEAVAVFQEGLNRDDADASLHYYLAQSFFLKKEYDKTKRELSLTIQKDTTGDYKAKAQTDLQAIEKVVAAAKKPEKKWSGSLSTGFEINSNASSEATKRPVIANEHAFKFPNSVSLNYLLTKSDPWTLNATYSHTGAYYSDTLDYLDSITHAPGLSLSYSRKLAGRVFIAQFSSSLTYTTVNGKFYSVSYPQGVTLIYSFADWHRITFSERPSITTYTTKGSKTEITSKQGFRKALSLTNTFFMNKEKSVAWDLGLDYKNEDPEGSNFVKDVYGASTSWTFPLMSRWESRTSFKFVHSYFPETIAVVHPRVDQEYIASTSVSVPLDAQWKLKGEYSYTHNVSNDPSFAYVNHAGGVSLSHKF